MLRVVNGHRRLRRWRNGNTPEGASRGRALGDERHRDGARRDDDISIHESCNETEMIRVAEMW